MIDAMEEKAATTTNVISLIGASNRMKIASQKGIDFFKCSRRRRRCHRCCRRRRHWR